MNERGCLTVKKLAASVLTLALGLTLVAGCGGSGASQPASGGGSSPAPSSTPAKPKENTKLTVLYGATSPSYAAFWIAKEKGFFDNHNLDVTLTSIDGDPRAAQAMVAGQGQISPITGPSFTRAKLGGADLIMIASAGAKLTDDLMVPASIKTADDLKGKQVGVSQFGGESDLETRFMLTKLGLTPDKDVIVKQVGGESARIAAMVAGSIQGGPVDMSLRDEMAKQGLHPLISMVDLDFPYQKAGVVVTGDFAKKNPDVVMDVLQAWLEAMNYMINPKNLDDTATIMAKYYRTDKVDPIKLQLSAWAKTVNLDAYPNIDGFKNILQTIQDDPKAKTADPAQWIDRSYIDKLKANGFIDKLKNSK